ncbi:MAG: bifunctional indole-3-glycerol phosphate synthase/phosphoribosylanthranilate isomerase, partial [Helicobacter sp.]|nr:bifunctional indole-3-glycerol phosphate synthase/phosphoribosylanthranilate isomerase [Helicobacter sp.]
MYGHATILKEIIEKKSKYPIRRRNRNLPLNPPSLENPLLMIAEIKRASPSSGKLSEIPCVKELAKSYLDSGADVVSILCEKDYFQGDIEDLLEVKMAYPWACVLRKDFIVQTEQIQESYDFGADMVLLIVALFMEGQNGGLEQLKNLNEKA